jgi:hypothetical protein
LHFEAGFKDFILPSRKAYFKLRSELTGKEWETNLEKVENPRRGMKVTHVIILARGKG